MRLGKASKPISMTFSVHSNPKSCKLSLLQNKCNITPYRLIKKTVEGGKKKKKKPDIPKT
jgi:hypothetical protein